MDPILISVLDSAGKLIGSAIWSVTFLRMYNLYPQVRIYVRMGLILSLVYVIFYTANLLYRVELLPVIDGAFPFTRWSNIRSWLTIIFGVTIGVKESGAISWITSSLHSLTKRLQS